MSSSDFFKYLGSRKASSVESKSTLTLNILDLPNTLSDVGDAGMLAFNRNQIYYRNDQRWLPLIGEDQLQAGNNITLTKINGNVTISAVIPPTLVSGPGVSTDNAVARFDGTTGKIIQNSTAILDDAGNLSLQGSLTSPTNLSLNPVGPNIVMNSKSLTDVYNMTIPTSASTNYDAILFNGATLNTGSGSGPRINLGTSFSDTGDTVDTSKILMAPGYGFGIGGASLTYHAPLAGSHKFYNVNNIPGSTPSLSIDVLGIKAPMYSSPDPSDIYFDNKRLRGFASISEGIKLSTDYSNQLVPLTWYNWETVVPWSSTNDPDNVALRTDCIGRIIQIGPSVQMVIVQGPAVGNGLVMYSVLAARQTDSNPVSFNILASSYRFAPIPTTQQSISGLKITSAGDIVHSQYVVTTTGLVYPTLGRTSSVAIPIAPNMALSYVAD